MKSPNLFLRFAFVLLIIDLFSVKGFSQSVTLCVKGVVVHIDDQQNLTQGNIAVNDSLTGSITYFLNIAEDDSHANTVPKVGDYYNYDSPSGIIAKINNYIFQTDSNNVDFLVEVINNYESQDNITMHSYNNIFPSSLGTLAGNHIGWQLDDNSQTALTNIAIPTSINIVDWPWLANQSTGFTISGGQGNASLFIRTRITEVKTCSSSDRPISRDSETPALLNKLIVYPNPISETITIEVDQNLVGSQYVITDQSGKPVLSGKIENEKTTVNVNHLTKGEYQVQAGGSKSLNFKVVKN